MKTSQRKSRGYAWALCAGLAAVLLLPVGASAASAAASDIKKLVGPDECGQCHKKEVEAWRQSHHYTTFYKLSRTKAARSIAKKLGIRRIKHESTCLNCHFTTMLVNGKPKVVAGITCESCHGAGRDWIKIHSDYGGKKVTKAQESPAHRKKRLADSVAHGMLLPSNLYAVANNCYQCHLVPNEKLVNVGGHKAGSNFELVAWSQGEVRHNYLSSKDGNGNPEVSVPTRRKMFVLGIALELEHSLRAVGKATVKAKYAVDMAKRVQVAVAKLNKIVTLIKAPEVNEMAKIGGSAHLRLNNEAELTRDADKVGKLARAFSDKYDGSTFSGLDKYLPTRFVGNVHG